MRVIHAEWEKRNLDVDTIELTCENGDEKHDIEQILADNPSTYCVCKVPVAQYKLVKEVQECGFVYIEDQIEVVHDLHEVKRNPLHQRLYDAMSYRKMTEEDIEELFTEIDKGMFGTDRISMDSFFATNIAAKRYRNWTADLIQNGALPYVILYKDTPAGFIILQTKDGKDYTSVLGGGYEKFRKSGLGVVQKEQEIVKMLGGKSVMTHVSSNNPNQLKALCMNGYLPKDIVHVFIKHN